MPMLTAEEWCGDETVFVTFADFIHAVQADTLKAAAERCLAAKFNDVGEPVKWKDIAWTFHNLSLGQTFDPVTGHWIEPAQKEPTHD